MTVGVEEPDAGALMTGGGDARILLDPETGLNRYFSAPYPRDVLAYASSTANDISAAAYARAEAVLAEIGGDPSPESMRHGWRRCAGGSAPPTAWPRTSRIVFAPSGTDLEYVALAAVAGRAPGGHPRDPARRRRGRLRLHPFRPRPLFRERDRARRRRPAGRAGAGPRRRQPRSDRHPGPRPDGAGAAFGLYRRADARPRSPPPRRRAATASSISSTARRPA